MALFFSPWNWRRATTNLIQERQMSLCHIPHPQFRAWVWKCTIFAWVSNRLRACWGCKIFSVSQNSRHYFFVSSNCTCGKHWLHVKCIYLCTVLVLLLEANYSGNKIIRSTVTVTLSLTLMFQFVQFTSNASDTDCQLGVKQSSFLWEATTANSMEWRVKGDGNVSCWMNPASLWPECQTQKALPDVFSLNIPSFYNPLLLSLSLCVVLKEPLSVPPSVKGVVKC